jgi:protein involved in sex pheromone biosynthesis
MKKLLTLALLSSLALSSCGETEEGDDDSLIDMYETDDDVDASEDTEGEEEIPTSIGPTDIPDDLIPSR